MTTAFRHLGHRSTYGAAIMLVVVAMMAAPARSATPDGPAACAALSGTVLPQANKVVIAGARSGRVAAREVCTITGQAAGAVTFTMKLPLADWNGKFAELSCGGSCAGSPDTLCDSVVRRGFACLAVGRAPKLFASDEASHVLALAAKDLLVRFYGKAPTANLFMGCGEGSHDALAEAQRYPQDFNAIVASAPVIDIAAAAQDLRARLGALRGRGGRPKLTMDDLQRLHRAAVAKCDADDGLKDGLISQPLRCGFDPHSVVCSSTPDGQCLSAAASDTAAGLYGNTASGLLPGSELEWAALIKPSAELLRWSASSSAATVSSEPAALDVAAFVGARGKLILVQGLADPIVSPRRTVQSYERLVRSMGGLVTTQGSVRLFNVPGLGFCGGGEGTNRINLLSVLETWAAGRAPDDFVAFRALDPAASPHPFAPDALDPAQAVYGGWMLGNPVSLEQAKQLGGTALSRPVFLYPYRTQYKDRGDPKLWMSFFAPGDFTLLSN